MRRSARAVTRRPRVSEGVTRYELTAAERAERVLALRLQAKCLRCGGRMVPVKSESANARDCANCGAKERGRSFSWSEYWVLPDSGPAPTPEQQFA